MLCTIVLCIHLVLNSPAHAKGNSQSDLVILVQQVVVLRSLRSKLAEALAEVHSTASSLHLQVAKHEDGDAFSSGGDANHIEHLFQQARKAISQTSNSCSEVCNTIHIHCDFGANVHASQHTTLQLPVCICLFVAQHACLECTYTAECRSWAMQT